jgi:DNA polymerase (family X)
MAGRCNEAIAAEFRRIARDLERQQANLFRVRAYRRAADVIAELPEDAAAIARRGDLIRIKGIGAELARKIETYCEYGRMDATDTEEGKGRVLARPGWAGDEVPSTVADWTTLPGLNASLVRYLYNHLRIRTLDDLEALVRSRFLRTLPGVMATDEDILEGIRRLRRGPDNLT